jgi:hypothetical protein
MGVIRSSGLPRKVGVPNIKNMEPII